MELAACKENWEEFLVYKKEKQHLSALKEQAIREFVDEKGYLPMCSAWQDGEFPAQIPVKKVVNKEGSTKKRVVYSFEGEEGIFLKFVAFCLYRFDDFFCENCYAFRRGVSAVDAIRRLKNAGVDSLYCLKADISNYFNSIDVERLLEKLSFVRERDENLYLLFQRILLEERVKEGKQIIREEHGAMAGTALSPFFANVYLSDMDHFFHREGVLYFRYSDDILLFAHSAEELEKYRQMLFDRIAENGLTLNPEKVKIYKPYEKIEFLGFSYHQGAVDLSDNTKRKIKAKIKRKAAALMRWQRKKELPPEKAAIGFIRAMNHKFYGTDCNKDDSSDGDDKANSSGEFSWKRWFFPLLTTDVGLKEVDAYMQQYIRYTVTGRHYKGNYRIRYEDMKNWGYRSLVNEFYKNKN